MNFTIVKAIKLPVAFLCFSMDTLDLGKCAGAGIPILEDGFLKFCDVLISFLVLDVNNDRTIICSQSKLVG